MALTFTPGNPTAVVAPLGGLDSNQYAYSSFIYPLDLGAPGAGKNHYMIFNINESSATNFQTATVNGGKAPSGAPTMIANQIAANQLDNSLSIYGQAPQQGGGTTGSGGGQAQPTIYDIIKQPIRRVATTIVLYMPENIQVGYAADWGNAEEGAAQEFTGFLRGVGSLQEVFKSFGASAVKNGGKVANEITNLNLSDAFSRQNRIVVNNHLEVIFNGINFRQFNFKWRFTPQSEDEALVVKNIIDAFKFYSAPELVHGSAGRFWIYPAEFDMQYYANGVPNDFLNKISTCALTSMQVNYTPSGHYSAHRPYTNNGNGINGAPMVITDMDLTFTEMQLITKDLALLGY